MNEISEFVEQPRTYEELHRMADKQLGILGKRNVSLTKEQGAQWWEIFEYLDFHANGIAPKLEVVVLL